MLPTSLPQMVADEAGLKLSDQMQSAVSGPVKTNNVVSDKDKGINQLYYSIFQYFI